MGLNKYTASIYLNLLSAITVGIYYTAFPDGVIFNLAALLWFVMLFANMAICIESNKSAIFRLAAMTLPVLLMFLQVLAVSRSESFWLVCQGLAFLYFLFSASHAWYLGNDRFATREPRRRPIVFGLQGVFFLLVLSLVGYFVYRLVVAPELTMSTPLTFTAGMLLLFPILIAAPGIALMRRAHIQGYSCCRKIIAWVLVIVITGNLLPVLSAPNAIFHAEKQFADVFGASGSAMELSLPEMVFGSRTNGYTVLYDQPYTSMDFDESDGQAGSFELKFDMYRPENKSGALPVLIRMHGSGGDKGARNNLLMNRAIAAEGYAVFDIQYGNEVVKPSNDRLVENVANFLNYLYENSSELNIDIGSIFLSGGSRGGKMALMGATAWANNKYYDLFNKVTVKGSVLFWGYMEDVFNRAGDERIIDLQELSSNMPPILNINAGNDGSVQGGYLMKGALLPYGVKVANVELPFGLHNAYANFYGPWGQMSEHYLLRFMQQF